MTDGRVGTPATSTFLFTDIEGSTRLEQRIGTERYAQIRERHRAILRALWAAHDGVEQGTEGDSFFVVFSSARQALAAAVAAQRALATEPWPTDAVVRVRMGLHTGEAELAGDSLVGLDINRAARIAAVAHGGQILASDATRALVGSSLPPGVALRDLGQHRLRDLGAPERLAQVDADDLPGDFPPIRSLDARPNNLPTQLTTFVGREREVAEAAALLSRTRLLTFTGPGGTGKTRLSLQVAASAADAFPDGIWFVALESVRDPAMVAPAIARSLGLADNAVRPTVDALVDSVGDGQVLFVLDNFEQVLGAGPVIAEILRRCPRLTALVTTRVALRISGEQEYPVPGLPAPPDTRHLSEMDRLNLPRALREHDLATLATYEAVRLFITRAMAVKPGFAVTNANAPAVAAISSTLHGMPLAIELAAARIKLLSPDQILTRLEHHLDLLTAGSRDLPERQQTLRGAIAWSYDLLDDGSRRLVDRLSVFRGGFQLETAETVCGPAAEIGGDVIDRIGELVDQSLVRVDDDEAEPRFSMLETIREFAAERLEARGEATALGARHAAAMVELAEVAAPQLSGSEQRLWLDRLEREHDNLRAALDWAMAESQPEVGARLAYLLWRFWQQRGYLNEARARFDAMDALDWDLEPISQARFAEANAGIAYWQSDQDKAVRAYDEALAIWRTMGDKSELANALYNRAYANLIDVMAGSGQGPHWHSGLAMLEEALALYRELGDKGGEGSILWGLGSYYYFTADAVTAEAWFRRSLELHRMAGQRTMEAWSLHMLSLSAVNQRHFDEALTNGRHALRHFYEAGDVSGVTLVLDDLAIIAAATGDLDRSGRLWGAARHLQQTTGTSLADYVEENYKLFEVPRPRDLLSPKDLAARAAEGAAMGLDEVVAYALDEVGPVPAMHLEADGSRSVDAAQPADA
jgi:predicted ATPase/class 3 adenylate cyclase